MKIQKKILIKVLKENWIWMAILCFLIGLKLIFYTFQSTNIIITNKDFFTLICYPEIKESDYIGLLISIYQIGMYLYLIYIYYTYEFEYSLENVILRINEKKWIIYKFIIILLFITISKTIYILFIYLFFSKLFILEISFIITPIILHLITTIVMISIINFFCNKFILILCFLIWLIYQFFYFPLGLFLTIVLIIINITLFRFKKVKRE